MNQIPRVSLGLPVFNGDDYLEAALESILSQTYENFELIISDNASTDGTAEICQRYAAQDERIRYYRNDKNLGASPNYNQVFYLSRGEYFKWAAHDDLLTPDFLASCVQALDGNPEAILCYTGAEIIDENSEVLRSENFEADVHSQQAHIKFRNVALALDSTTAAQIPLIAFGLIRSEVLKQTGLIGNFPNSDVVLIAELSLHGAFLELPEPLFLWRHHPKQSVRGELSSDRNRTLWFDTSLENKIVLHKWMILKGYVDGINGAPIGRYEKLLCYLYMVQWVARSSNFKSLVKDVLLAAWTTNLRILQMPRFTYHRKFR